MGGSSFRLGGKKLAIALNLIEGTKCLFFVFNRSWKAYISEHAITFSSDYSHYFVWIVIWLPDTLARSGILLNCSITVERFFMIAFPVRFHKKRLIQHDNVLIFTIVTTMLLFQTNPVILFILYSKPHLDHSKKFGSDDLVSMIVAANPARFNLYISLQLVGAVMFRIVPILVTNTFNVLTVVTLCRHNKQRKILVHYIDQLPLGKSTASQTNRMLLVSSCLFALMASLKPLNRGLRLAIPTYGEGEKNSLIYIMLNDTFLLVDNMAPLVNIIVYSRLSSQFYARLKALCPWS
ncbi:hypothetical protein ElyMa_004250800 [Elysia marginata]|uniref:G-protein coupled receptors family 1 profile domain-containing protein n=1 Tax=Elysia marginata TaxID=1093978 RepID=A0AAV4GUK0_9GAST|nr:hypothetical protein ElyMa_004250800 [Elysia marginata]